MIKKRQITHSIILLAALLAACSPLGSGEIVSPPPPTAIATATFTPTLAPTLSVAATTFPATSAAPGATPTTAATGQPGYLTVTLAQNDQTVTLQPGQRFLLDLGDTMRWTVAIENQAVISRVTGITVIKGAQGVYQADQPGQTVLNAVGLPVCGQGQCSQLALDFSMTIVVTAPTTQPSSNHY